MQKVRSYSDLIQRFREAATPLGSDLLPIGNISTPMGDYTLYVIRFSFGNGAQKICLSTGMHGDEPAGVEALIKGLGRLKEHQARLDAEFLVFPCDNPSGWELDTRENWAGLDLNREFAKTDQAPEIALVQAALDDFPADFILDLHEDIDTHGMYLYERARKGRNSLAEEMVQALRSQNFPIHEEDWIEGLPASGGIIWPSGRLRRSELPKPVYLWHRGVRHLITTESPGKLELETRIAMQMICFDLFVEWLAAGRFLPIENELEDASRLTLP